jgi:thioredoxin 2
LQLQERSSAPLQIVDVDSEDVAEVAARYNVRTAPTLILFKDGEEVARCNGFQSIGMLREWAAPHLGW